MVNTTIKVKIGLFEFEGTIQQFDEIFKRLGLVVPVTNKIVETKAEKVPVTPTVTPTPTTELPPELV